MDAPPLIQPPKPPPFPERPPSQSHDGGRSRLGKALAPLGVVGLLLLKFGAKLKFLILPILKFFPVILKTGGTMFASVWLYALAWGWWFALGFVLLIFVHECGHLLAAKRVGLKVGAPVFIPFMGAFIALKEAPRNAWIEAQVGIGGRCWARLARRFATESISPPAIRSFVPSLTLASSSTCSTSRRSGSSTAGAS